jgi:hypothetical protein
MLFQYIVKFEGHWTELASKRSFGFVRDEVTIEFT